MTDKPMIPLIIPSEYKLDSRMFDIKFDIDSLAHQIMKSSSIPEFIAKLIYARACWDLRHSATIKGERVKKIESLIETECDHAKIWEFINSWKNL